jgi:SAM-dependent methyltransferase
MASSICGAYQTGSPYALKRQRHSSHSILLRLLPETGNGRRLLDLGCADGYMSRLFAERGFSVTAIDAPGLAQPNFPDGIEFLEADLDRGLPPLDGDFDFVICADILEHLRHPDALLRHIRSKIAPGGKLIASLPNSGNIYFRLNILAGRFPAHERGLFDRTHVHFYMWDGWKDLLMRSGFRITAVQPTVIPFSHAWPHLPGFAAALESMYWLAARAWKTLCAYQFAIVAEVESP